jgi:hypothetical protein
VKASIQLAAVAVIVLLYAVVLTRGQVGLP